MFFCCRAWLLLGFRVWGLGFVILGFTGVGFKLHGLGFRLRSIQTELLL